MAWFTVVVMMATESSLILSMHLISSVCAELTPLNSNRQKTTTGAASVRFGDSFGASSE